MIACAAILFAAGWVGHALQARTRRDGRPELGGVVVQRQLRRTFAPWIR